jgi:hypothetical protein
VSHARIAPCAQCGDADGEESCSVRVAGGACHNGSDAPLRCAASCGVCAFQQLAHDAYSCDELRSKLFPRSWDEGRCERKRQRCARPPDTPAAVRAGGISATMRRILRDFPQYSPVALSQPGGKFGTKAPWVVSLQDFVTDEEAAAFIDGCSRHFDRSLAGDQLSPVRTSSQCWCSGNACERHALTQGVAHRIANLTQVPGERYFEPFQILKYLPGQARPPTERATISLT